LRWGAALVALATGLRLAWVLAVPTVPVSDFAMYRESANYLSEFGVLDPGFIYMPGFVVLLAWIKNLGGDLLAQKLLGVAFGGLGAAGMFALTDALIDRKSAIVATLVYAAWPAGVAMSSVVGTDVPAAVLLVAALALLATLGPRRPLAAAIAFGVTMGLAAWVRAVALPLSGLALGYWLARRERPGRALLLTGVGLIATLVVLLPWGIRHLRQSGELYFTDDHGGITALIGANPNSEGSYTRALNQTFKNVTGRSVLDEPHRQTDRAAYAIAREWFRFQPRYAFGLAVKKADRLFDPEHRLLYWPIFRPGVLVGRPATFFAERREAVAELADGFGLTVTALALAGLAMAIARRRWTLLALAPFTLALIATYVIFFAEPRYRIPIEMLAFPFAGLAVVELVRTIFEVATSARGPRGDLKRSARAALLSLGPGLLLVIVWRASWPSFLDWGKALRARHGWAVTEVDLDGRTRLLLWAPEAVPPAGLPRMTPLRGAPNGVHLGTGDSRATGARLLLGGGPVPAGEYAVRVQVEAEGQPANPPPRLALAGTGVDVVPGAPLTLEARLRHPGGPLRFGANLVGLPRSSVWITGPKITSLR
jgi:hypothetical protein